MNINQLDSNAQTQETQPVQQVEGAQNTGSVLDALRDLDAVFASQGVSQEALAEANAPGFTHREGTYKGYITADPETMVRIKETQKDEENLVYNITRKTLNFYVLCDEYTTPEGETSKLEKAAKLPLSMSVVTKYNGEDLSSNNPLHKKFIENNVISQARLREDILNMYGMNKRDFNMKFKEEHGREPSIEDLIGTVLGKEFKVYYRAVTGKTGWTNHYYVMHGERAQFVKSMLDNEGSL